MEARGEQGVLVSRASMETRKSESPVDRWRDVKRSLVSRVYEAGNFGCGSPGNKSKVNGIKVGRTAEEPEKVRAPGEGCRLSWLCVNRSTFGSYQTALTSRVRAACFVVRSANPKSCPAEIGAPRWISPTYLGFICLTGRMDKRRAAARLWEK